MPARTRDVRSLRDWSGCIMSRSTSGAMPKRSRTWSSISRCCAVTATAVSIPGFAFNAPITGAILMASGRVPKTTITRLLIVCSIQKQKGRVGGPSARVHGRTARASERRFQLRQHLEQVADQADVGHLEDRRVRILVDRHDRAGVLDAGQVLDRAADADRDVQLRGDDLAGLAHLHLVGAVAG